MSMQKRDKNWVRGIGDKKDQEAFGEAATIIVWTIGIGIAVFLLFGFQ